MGGQPRELRKYLVMEFMNRSAVTGLESKCNGEHLFATERIYSWKFEQDTKFMTVQQGT